MDADAICRAPAAAIKTVPGARVSAVWAGTDERWECLLPPFRDDPGWRSLFA